MSKYIIGYIDEQESEQTDFANLMEDVEEGEDAIFSIVFFEVSNETILEDLMNQILQSNIQCLVVDYHLSVTGVPFEGSDIMEEFQRIRPLFPKLIFTNKESAAIENVSNQIIHTINDKSIKQDTDRAKNFRKKIKTLIDNYEREKKQLIQELKNLEQKRHTTGLSAQEEDRFVELNKLLDDTFNDGQGLSRSFYSVDTNKRLDSLIEKTENILRKLS